MYLYFIPKIHNNYYSITNSLDEIISIKFLFFSFNWIYKKSKSSRSKLDFIYNTDNYPFLLFLSITFYINSYSIWFNYKYEGTFSSYNFKNNTANVGTPCSLFS